MHMHACFKNINYCFMFTEYSLWHDSNTPCRSWCSALHQWGSSAALYFPYWSFVQKLSAGSEVRSEQCLLAAGIYYLFLTLQGLWALAPECSRQGGRAPPRACWLNATLKLHRRAQKPAHARPRTHTNRALNQWLRQSFLMNSILTKIVLYIYSMFISEAEETCPHLLHCGQCISVAASL